MSQIAAEKAASLAPVDDEADESFQTGRILTIVSGHFVHDVYSAFIPSMLPLLIDKLTLSLAQAGMLTVFLQLPGVLNVLIGYMADRISVRYFVIFAPAITATLLSLTGTVSSYAMLLILMLVTGVSIAVFHAPAPAMIGQISGKRVGMGMSLFMAGGELARAVGPLVAVWAIGEWGLEGSWRMMFLGWVASGILYWRLSDVSTVSRRKAQTSLRATMPAIRRLFVPLAGVIILQQFILTAMAVYMVVLLDGEGQSLAAASSALALWQFAGFWGALTGGTVSDLIGRKQTMFMALGLASLLMLGFLNASGWLLILVLVVSGFITLSVTPIMQAMVQEQIPEHRATANGLFMLLSFLSRSLITLVIGLMGDAIGLHDAFVLSALLSLLAAPLVLLLPAGLMKTEARTN